MERKAHLVAKVQPPPVDPLMMPSLEDELPIKKEVFHRENEELSPLPVEPPMPFWYDTYDNQFEEEERPVKKKSREKGSVTYLGKHNPK